MAFDGREGKFIEMEEAAALTKAWRDGDNGEVIGLFLGKEKLEQLLLPSECMGIRIYMGVDAEGNKTVVLAGADEDQNDITDLILDKAWPCPPYCGSSNGLNSDS